MAKDGPVFRLGKTQGEVRYPPCEVRDEVLEKIHRDFRLHPTENIADFPRHIPYQSDKKSFQEKTGRDSFHGRSSFDLTMAGDAILICSVFQYTFQIPGEEAVWTMMWDYNIGLVRTTSLFKCNEYPKVSHISSFSTREACKILICIARPLLARRFVPILACVRSATASLAEP